MNLFALSGLLLAITCILLALIVSFYKKTKLHYMWILFNIVIAVWGLGAFLIGKASTPSSALLSWKIAHVGVIFIPVCFFHSICIFCNIEAKRKKYIFYAYLQGLIFIILNFSGLLISKVKFVFNTIYYNEPTNLIYPVFVFIWISLVIWANYELINYYLNNSGVKKKQSLYFLIGVLLGFSGGVTNFFPMFGIGIYPFGNLTIPIYCLITTYAILRYHLLDISVVFKRSMAYSLSAGLLMGLFVVMVMSITRLFSAFVHVDSLAVNIASALVIALLFNPLRNYIQRVIDGLFYKKSYDYFATVRQVSSTLTIMFDLQKIYKFIGDTVYEVLGLKDVYLLASLSGGDLGVVYHDSRRRRSRKPKDRPEGDEEVMKLSDKSGIARFFRRSGDLLVKDELSVREETPGEETAEKIRDELKGFRGEAAAPVFVDRELALLMILGEKSSGDTFTNEDMDLLRTISDQTAIAIKNARLYQDKVNSEKLASIGMMSATFAHEIRNPLTSLKTFAQLMPEKYNDVEFRETFSRIVVGEIEKIDGLIKDLLDFASEKKSGHINNFNLTELIDGIADEIKNKLEFEKSEITVSRDYNGTAVNMAGDAGKLKQAFSNIMINGCQAMHGEGELRIDIKPDAGHVEIKIEDTGEGIHPDDLPGIFDPFVTTKDMGIGLGLAISKRIIENHNGEIHVESQLSKGTTFFVSLPIL
ncbi:MAG: hypothetical protein C4526_04155 [Nitrospiraceae bacterium]|nr:MAG: hypothetical protein C4526_04155 [Nitrospiraceae bacterium]